MYFLSGNRVLAARARKLFIRHFQSFFEHASTWCQHIYPPTFMPQVSGLPNGKLWQIKSGKIFHLCFACNCIEYMTSGKTIQSAKLNLIGGGAQAHGGGRRGEGAPFQSILAALSPGGKNWTRLHRCWMVIEELDNCTTPNTILAI